MRAAHLTALLAGLGAAQLPAPTLITGTLNEHLVPDGNMAQVELRPSTDRDLPGVSVGDQVFRINTPQFRPPGAANGLAVALVETKAGAFLFVDANLDGRLSESERHPGRDVSVDIIPARPGALALPFHAEVTTDVSGGGTRRVLHFTASFRAEGDASIGGRRTLVSLPFSMASGTVDVRLGRIGIDANGDGKVDLGVFDGPEVVWTQGTPVPVRVAEHCVSVQSVDVATRALVLREHALGDCRYVELRTGAPMPEFAFTDFGGAARRLSDFKGKYLLIDFWGTWCGPCVAEMPMVKEARDRFRGRGFEVLGIDYEKGTATVDQVRAFLREKEITWPNATPDSIKDLVEQRLRILSFPTKILLDRDGRILDIHSSTIERADLMAMLERVTGKY